MQIAVVGRGHVGQAVERLFTRYGHQVVVWDRDSATIYPTAAFRSCDFAVVCVGTPPAEDGGADLTAVTEAIERLPLQRVLLKSTVPPGTTNRMVALTGKEICYWPEYVGESGYYNPFFATEIDEVPFVVLGGEPPIRRWFIDRLLEVLGPTKKYFQCSAGEAELIKHAENAYFAIKVVFANEFRRVCEACGADWHTVREGWLLDPRVERMHTAAFERCPGFDGKCLPKDLDALIATAREAGYRPWFFEQAADSNRSFQSASPETQPISSTAAPDRSS